MEFIKVCMECGNEFETQDLFDNTLTCPKCGSGDVYQPVEDDYDDVTLEQCFEAYHESKVACQCDGDNKIVIYLEE